MVHKLRDNNSEDGCGLGTWTQNLTTVYGFVRCGFLLVAHHFVCCPGRLLFRRIPRDAGLHREVVGESQEPGEGQRHLELVGSPPGADTHASGGWQTDKVLKILYGLSSTSALYPTPHEPVNGLARPDLIPAGILVLHSQTLIWVSSPGCSARVPRAPRRPGVHGGESGTPVRGPARGVHEPAGVRAQPTHRGAPAEHQDAAAELGGRREGAQGSLSPLPLQVRLLSS